MKNYDDLLAEEDWDEEEEAELEYETVLGNETIVFLKAGSGGKIHGAENKYQKMAQKIHERLGATVIYASNPEGDDNAEADEDEKKIRDTVSALGVQAFRLYLWGTSDGAYKNLETANRFPETKQWIGVNASFITVQGFVEKLQALPDVKKLLLYGTDDEDSKDLFPDLYQYENANLTIRMVEGADHFYTNMLPRFIETVDFIGDEA